MIADIIRPNRTGRGVMISRWSKADVDKGNQPLFDNPGLCCCLEEVKRQTEEHHNLLRRRQQQLMRTGGILKCMSIIIS